MRSSLAYAREEHDIKHIQELFGSIKINQLKPDHIKHAYATARQTGRFSESEIRRIHVKLKQILEEALNNELINRNPCNGIKLPKPPAETRTSLSIEEAQRFLTCLLKDVFCSNSICALILLECGLRRGEALGLSWSDYDLSDPANPVLRIVYQYTTDKTLRAPKSRMSRRVISINATLKNALDTWKVLQREELGKYGLQQTNATPIVHGISTATHGGETHAVITRVEGHNFSRWFRNFCVDNGFCEYQTVTHTVVKAGKTYTRGTNYKGLVPHALRHIQATLLIGSGSDIKTVQARLGHASPSTTLGIYAHAIEANDRKAAEVFDAVIGGSSCDNDLSTH